MKNIFALSLVIVSLAGCARHAPASLSPNGIRTWQANEVAVALGTVSHTAIELNKVQVCDPVTVGGGEPSNCHALLSDSNTRVVLDAVEDGLKTIKAVPDGWKATGLAALTRISARLDLAGRDKLNAYLTAAKAIIDALSS